MKYGSHIALGLGCSVLGLIVGVAIDANFHPNYMRVWIDPLNALHVAPQNGDMIEWDQLGGDGQPVSINFGTNPANIPCVNSPNGPLSKGICEVQYPAPTGTYQYTCSVGSDQICDPNLGPVSGTGPGGGMSVKRYIDKLLKNIKRTYEQKQSGPVLQETSSALIRGSSGTQKAGASVQCDTGGATQVIPRGQDNPAPIVIAPGGKIYWDSPGGAFGTGFTVSDPNKLCSSLSNSICIVDASITPPKDVNYTAQVLLPTPCSANTQASVQVRSQAANPVARAVSNLR